MAPNKLIMSHLRYSASEWINGRKWLRLIVWRHHSTKESNPSSQTHLDQGHYTTWYNKQTTTVELLCTAGNIVYELKMYHHGEYYCPVKMSLKLQHATGGFRYKTTFFNVGTFWWYMGLQLTRAIYLRSRRMVLSSPNSFIGLDIVLVTAKLITYCWQFRQHRWPSSSELLPPGDMWQQQRN